MSKYPKQIRWIVSSSDMREVVFAADQFAAWDTLRDRPAEEFSLIAKAECNESADPFLIRTSLLMLRWGRREDSRRFVERGVELELMPDTTEADAADLKVIGESNV